MKILKFFAVAMAIAAVALCGCVQFVSPQEQSVLSVTLRINGQDAQDVILVDYMQIRSMSVSVKVETSGGAGKAVDYYSSDEEIASIDDSGIITLYGDGECTITAVSRADSDVYDSFVLRVYYPEEMIMAEIGGAGVYRIQAEDADLSSAGSYVVVEDILDSLGMPTGEIAVGGLGYKGASIIFRVKCAQSAYAVLRMRVAGTVNSGHSDFAFDDAVSIFVNGEAYITEAMVEEVEGAADYNGYQVIEVSRLVFLRKGTSEIIFTDIAGAQGAPARMPNFDWIEFALS